MKRIVFSLLLSGTLLNGTLFAEDNQQQTPAMNLDAVLRKCYDWKRQATIITLSILNVRKIDPNFNIPDGPYQSFRSQLFAERVQPQNYIEKIRSEDSGGFANNEHFDSNKWQDLIKNATEQCLNPEHLAACEKVVKDYHLHPDDISFVKEMETITEELKKLYQTQS